MIVYLTPEWVEALDTTASASPSLTKVATGLDLGVTQVVRDTPNGTFIYHLIIDEGRVRFGVGPAHDEHARFEQSYRTAVQVATGKLAAQEAFVKGKVTLTGDHNKIIEAQPLFSALESVFDHVRQNTDYSAQ